MYASIYASFSALFIIALLRNQANASSSSTTTKLSSSASSSRSLQFDDDDDNKSTVHPLLNKVQPFGFQSTKSQGHDFATSIIASPNPAQGFFLTGTTTGITLSPNAENALHVGMHCYIMQLKPFEDEWAWVKKIGAHKKNVATSTTCTSIHTMKYQDKDEMDEVTRVIVAGYTEGDELFNPEEGVLSFSQLEADSEVEFLEDNRINGFVLVLEVPNLLATRKSVDPNEIKLIGGKMLTPMLVQYPVKVVPISSTDLVVASLVTDDGSLNFQSRLQSGLGAISDFQPTRKYGNFFDVKLERLSLIENNPILKRKWSQIYSTTDGRGAHVTSLLYDSFENTVIFAGSTHGRGEAFGILDPLKSNGEDIDGYVTKVSGLNGELWSGDPISVRIETNPGKEEFVNSLCTHGRALYIVGSTDAIIDPTVDNNQTNIETDTKLNAFIQKRVIDNMKVIWTRQVGTADVSGNIDLDYQNVEGLGCAVAHDEDIVYLSGTVTAGASVVAGTPGVGNKDVFVQALDSISGNPSERFPITQVGSSSDDFVADDGGGLAIDQYGNAVLYGTTKGSLVAEKEFGGGRFATSYADIFVMSFLVDSAEHVTPIEKPGSGPVFVSQSSRSKSKVRSSFEIAGISLFAAGAVILIFLSAYHFGKRRTTNEIGHQQDKDIERYLEEFEGDTNKVTSLGSSGDNQLYDVSGYYGQNFAAGKDKDESIVLPGEVMFNNPSDLGTTPSQESTADKKTTYEELMESYKNIQNDLSGGNATDLQFKITNPDTDNDHKII